MPSFPMRTPEVTAKGTVRFYTYGRPWVYRVPALSCRMGHSLSDSHPPYGNTESHREGGDQTTSLRGLFMVPISKEQWEPQPPS